MRESIDIDVVVKKIIELPKDFKLGSKSEYTLVIESGYLECHNQITEHIISQVLEGQPERIEEWIILSEDQRIPEGCYLKIEDAHFYMAAFSIKDGYKEELTEYNTLQDACAAFIKHRLKFCRNLAISKIKK